MDVWIMTLGANDDAGTKVLGAYATKNAARPDMEKHVRDLARFGRQIDEAFATEDSVYVEVGLDWIYLQRQPLIVEDEQPALTTTGSVK